MNDLFAKLEDKKNKTRLAVVANELAFENLRLADKELSDIWNELHNYLLELTKEWELFEVIVWEGDYMIYHKLKISPKYFENSDWFSVIKNKQKYMSEWKIDVSKEFFDEFFPMQYSEGEYYLVSPLHRFEKVKLNEA